MFLSFRPRFLAFLAVVFLSFLPCGARAEGLKPLPELSKDFDLAGYAAKTDSITKSFDDIPLLGFTVSLPKNWVERSVLGQQYGELIRYEGPVYGDVRPYFSVKRLQIGRENTARLELVTYLLRQGYVLRSMREIDDRHIEAMYVIYDQSGGSDFAVRVVGRIAGPEMDLAEYAIPVAAWDDQLDEQTFAIRSFKFLKDSDAPIEKSVLRVYYDTFQFEYPASWIFGSEEAPADNRATISLINQGELETRIGDFRLTVLSSTSLKDHANRQFYPINIPDQIKAIRKKYEERGFVIGERIESRKVALGFKASFNAVDVYRVSQIKTKYQTNEKPPQTDELWLGVFASAAPDHRVYIAELFTPMREHDLYAWALNTRAFELIVKTIK